MKTTKIQQIGVLVLDGGANFTSDIQSARKAGLQTIPRNGFIELWTQQKRRK